MEEKNIVASIMKVCIQNDSLISRQCLIFL